MAIRYTCKNCGKSVMVSGGHSFGFGGMPSVPCSSCGGKAVMNGKHTRRFGKKGKVGE